MKSAQTKNLLAISFLSIVLTLFQFLPAQNHQKATPITGGQAAFAAPTLVKLSSQATKTTSKTAKLESLALGIDNLNIQARPEAITRPSVENLSPAFKRFIEEVADGHAGSVRGVYVAGVLALPVVQQPAGDIAFVSNLLGTATQFQSAAQYGVTGLLAHNYLSGALFYGLSIGQEVRIVFGDGSYRRYQVQKIDRFKKLTPSSLQSDLIDLSTGATRTTNQVFDQYYRGQHRLTFQTCLESKGISNWGLTFIIATPLDADR
jgi:hypothetical protein